MVALPLLVLTATAILIIVRGLESSWTILAFGVLYLAIVARYWMNVRG